MKHEEFKSKIFTELPEVKSEYDKLDQEYDNIRKEIDKEQ